MDRKEKMEFVAGLHERLEKVPCTFLVEYKGLDVEAMNRLRRELKDANARFHVVKNRLLKRASDDTDTACIQDQMEGPCGITLVNSDEDVVRPAKVLVDFSKDFEALVIKAGQISGKAIDAAGIRRLADLPGKEVLLAQALSAMQAVPASFVRVLNSMMSQLVYVLKAIEDKKSESA